MGVDGPAEGLDHLAQVGAHGRFRGAGIVRRESFDDRLVLAKGTLRPSRPQDGPVLEADALRLEVREQPGGSLMIGDLPDPLVKLSIQLRVAKRVGPGHAASHFDEHLAQLAEIGRRGVFSGVSRHQLLEGDPDLLDLERLLVGDQPNPGPAIRLASDQAFLVEPDQGGANAGSTGPEQAGKVCLDQPFVGLEPAADDRVSELPVDPDAGVQRLNRGKGPAGCPPGRSVSNTGFHG